MRSWKDTVDTGVSTDVVFLIDADDPVVDEYRSITGVRYTLFSRWQPMVHKLNHAALRQAENYRALGFMGDDHRPRTLGWNAHFVQKLRKCRYGIAYGNDLYQGERLPTQWTMTSNIVNALGCMVPAPVEHLYCDNAVLELGRGAKCVYYMADVVIEHVHPVTGKVKSDAGYKRVNSREQYQRDGAAFRKWKQDRRVRDIALVTAL